MASTATIIPNSRLPYSGLNHPFTFIALLLYMYMIKTIYVYD